MTVIEKQYMDAVIEMNRRQRNHEQDWEQRRFEIAKDAMCAMLSNAQIVDSVTEAGEPVWGTPAAITATSVKLADLLIEELKKK